ncbi:MAG TPA: glycoside hydrolase family 44 protein, partial [Opitutaceae bacterium]
MISLPRPSRLIATFAALLCFASASEIAAQTVHISIDPTQNRVLVSPYLYGKNVNLGSAQAPLADSDWTLLHDAGVHMVRAHGGNNGTKYNWQKRLSSHPDWYNNVYGDDWDYGETALQQHLPGVQAMWCFQLLGKVADNTAHNFDDWSYNQSQWWSGVEQNLAGGGTPNPAGGAKALKEGDTSLYLTDTSSTTSVAILDHWSGPGGLGLDRTGFRYWNMDNEPEIWNGTHDDVMPTQLSAEAFMQRFFDYAKQARATYPGIKIVGPVTANEWQWYNWATPITADGRTYPWLEYFIKRIGEEQTRTGIRLLDVLDIHYYPAVTDSASIVQLHRIFFDTTFANPEANGVHAVNGGWDTSITQEYIFGRCQGWLNQYLGANNGVTFGLTEVGIAVTNAPVASVWYASTIGEFMKHGVEIFTPWSWQPGMWEVLHLYSRYNYGTCVLATSDDE